MKNTFVCPRCGNSDPEYIGMKNGQPYCRRCIGFHGLLAEKEEKTKKNVRLDLRYSLSKEQNELSNKIIANFKSGVDTLVYAVCGSGKTEISYGVIAYAMSKGLRVGFALPRKDVVIELHHRFVEAFPDNKIIAVYGSHNEVLEGDCVILTTHQLYRYPDYFDLLVLDEIDAFPFKGSEILISFFNKALKGHCVMMTATPSKDIIEIFSKPGRDILTLRTRFHKKPIPVPECKIISGPFKYLFIIKKLRQYRKKKKPCFIFVPTINEAGKLYRIVSIFAPGGDYVSSKKSDREAVIRKFKKGKLSYLVTTAVLERGVTIKGLQVIVFNSDDRIYDEAALIQIAGRAGRKADAPNGEVIFIGRQESEGMKHAIMEIKHCNTYLHRLPS